MTQIGREKTRAAFSAMDSLSPQEKGRALERLVGDVFCALPGLDLLLTDVKDHAGAEELDLVFHNDVHERAGIWMYGPEVIVECKNWSAAVGSSEVSWFVDKLRTAGQQAGILVAANGITGDPAAYTQAMYEVNKARLMKPRVDLVVVTRQELEDVDEVAQLRELLWNKLTVVRVLGRVDGWPQSETERETKKPGRSTDGDRELSVEVRAPALFEAMNARVLDSPGLGRRFIAPAGFIHLAAAQNALVTGARGTGKTTLLRMMESDSFAAWLESEPAAPELRLAHGVYLTSEGVDTNRGQPRRDDALVSAAYAARVVVTVIRQLAKIHKKAGYGSELEQQAAAAIAHDRRLDSEPSSFAELHMLVHDRMLGLSRQLREIPADSDAEPLMTTTEDSEDFFAAARAVIGIWSELVGHRERWCLLLDDFECAPAAVATTLVRVLQSSDPTLSVKVAMSPASADVSVRQAAPLHDFHLVRLPDARSGERFLSAILSDVLPPGTDPHALLGASFDATLDDAVRDLAAIDPSFADWLAEAGRSIPAADPGLRKIAPLIVLRRQLLRENGQPPSPRALEVWTGLPTLVRIFDGNPRFFLTFLNTLRTPLGDLGVISRQEQAQALSAVLEDFARLLMSMRAGTSGHDQRSVLDLLDRIGHSLRRRFYGPFSPDPVLSFVVDRQMADVEIHAVQAAINAGGLIQIEPGGESGRHELHGGRLRLTYLLAPRYGLPPRMGRALPLSQLLREEPLVGADWPAG